MIRRAMELSEIEERVRLEKIRSIEEETKLKKDREEREKQIKKEQEMRKHQEPVANKVNEMFEEEVLV